MTEDVLLIGVDGGDYRTLEPMLEAGELPNIEGLINRGFRGTLTSSVPPWTPTAWTDLTTGKNPGKHGIFDFKNPESDQLVDSGDVRTNALWDCLSAVGEPSITVNVPVTHPAPTVNGVLIPGYLGPEADETVAHPDGIIEELHNAIGEYRIYKSDDAITDTELCEEYLRLLEMRKDAMIYLCNEYDWSFGMIQFQRTDTVFHEIPEKQYVRRIYRKLDECIGQLLTETSATNVLLASDHGMGETGDWDFRINSWLLKNGYLETSTDGYESGWQAPTSAAEQDSSDNQPERTISLATATRYASDVGLTPRRIEGVVQRLGLDGVVRSVLPEDWIQTALQEGGEGIDIENSAAYCPSGPGLGIRCENDLKGELIEELADLRDPDGEQVFEWVRSADEVYNGPELESAPDILALPREMNYFVSATITAGTFPESRYRFNHKTDGILIGAGSDVLHSDDNLEASITDVAPTVLALNDVPLDVEFDGAVLDSILDSVDSPAAQTYSSAERQGSDASVDDVESRLEDLGYME